jgi:hypothetical protein
VKLLGYEVVASPPYTRHLPILASMQVRDVFELPQAAYECASRLRAQGWHWVAVREVIVEDAR